ncbi:MAG: YceI family protein [Flavobacteriaceae bacterium]|nr:YceI family protein [Flavobacteriaceae bacterium]
MKKVLFYSLILLFIIVASCKKEKPIEKKLDEKSYSIDVNNSVVDWTAYKTTGKLPVKGVFTEVKINKSAVASSPIEVLNGLEFEIPVASIYSKDTIRDGKLTASFFGAMKNTLKLKGTFHTEENGKGKISLTMNGLTKDLPFTYEVYAKNIDINATMNLDNWQTQAAIEALNVVCNDLHKGADGISKTWSDVAIHAQIKTVLEK